MRNIPLSPQHGVNPSMSQCYYCMKEKNELLLLGKLPGDAEAPRKIVANLEPCDECAELMKQGCILISVRDGETGNNPYRTGGWAVVKDSAVQRLRKAADDPSVVDKILEARFAFIENKTWKMMGLPEVSHA